MTNLEKAKEIIKAHIDRADCGIFNTHNICGDKMTMIYNGEGLSVHICYGWAYFEVFGLSDSEFEELRQFYRKVRDEDDE